MLLFFNKCLMPSSKALSVDNKQEMLFLVICHFPILSLPYYIIIYVEGASERESLSCGV